MKVLIIGSGGREHALCYKIKESEKVEKIYAIPGNGGISRIAQCIDIKIGKPNYFKEIREVVEEEGIDLTIVGPEAPLVDGLVNYFQDHGLLIFGPEKDAAIIEGSKVFAKEFMSRHNIPTAKYQIFSDYENAVKFIKERSYPLVVKYDGLAAGKGVFICKKEEEALEALKKIFLEKIFSPQRNKVVIEDFEEGREISLLAFCDGEDFICLPSSQDHKAIYDGDKGPNTGGMGAYSPYPLVNTQLLKEIKEKILYPTLRGLKEEGRSYKGILYLGLIKTKEGVKVLEYNARLGDPEAQVLLPRLETDLVDIILACLKGNLKDVDVNWSSKACLCVVLASKGYPGSYERGKEIFGLEIEEEDLIIFHAGTKIVEGKYLTNGGRVLGVTALGEDIKSAKEKVYRAIEKIRFEGMQFRRDIGDKAYV
jgi:phosphoribosylamine--glycine ligase